MEDLTAAMQALSAKRPCGDLPAAEEQPRQLPAPLPDRAKIFDISVALVGEGPAAIATAQAAALTRLSEQMARDLAR